MNIKVRVIPEGRKKMYSEVLTLTPCYLTMRGYDSGARDDGYFYCFSKITLGYCLRNGSGVQHTHEWISPSRIYSLESV